MEQSLSSLLEKSDESVLSLVLSGKVSRNRHFEFFNTRKGRKIFKKAKMIEGVLKDLSKGAEITDEEIRKDNILVTIENVLDKYRRTIVMDKMTYEIFKEKI